MMSLSMYNPTANAADYRAWYCVYKHRIAHRYIRKARQVAHTLYSKKMGNPVVLAILVVSVDINLATARAILGTYAMNRAHVITITPPESMPSLKEAA